MIQLKPGVRLLGIRAPIVLAIMIAERVYEVFGETLVITSVVDGTHMRASLHYVGAAVDVRLPKHDVERLMKRLADSLGEEYDVVLETDHFHVEWQPKVPL